MACVDTFKISSELNLTPSRKRKRQFEKLQQQEEQNSKTTAAITSCFTNAAFSSTPKKILGKRRLHLSIKENADGFLPNIGLEVKSIADIVKNNDECNGKNPYEILRKPPKKKKRQVEEGACFENPALNLDLPEKQFNPYEVVRDVHNNRPNCFINPALNLKIQDAPASRNPFEIKRETPNESKMMKAQVVPDLRNPFEIPPKLSKESTLGSPNPCNLRIGLPFMPNVGCRINFKDMSMSQLTPSKLLADKLIFSPVPRAKVSLGSIGEETTMDIGKELDRYQLELENSINEAKQRKHCIVDDAFHSQDSNLQVQLVDIEKKIKFTQKLAEISEDNEETTEHTEQQINFHKNTEKEDQIDTPTTNHNPFEYDLVENMDNEKNIGNTNKNPFEYESSIEKYNQEVDGDGLAELYGGSDVEDSFDFKAPAPFARAYTKSDVPKLTVTNESFKNENAIKSSETDEHTKKPMNVKNMIRKSIRKIMHPHQLKQEQKLEEEEIHEKPEHEKHNGIINAIRQSLRRKPARIILEEEPQIKECEISIIDSSERIMKLKSDLIQNEYAKIEDLTNEKKHNIRNSIRKSTREVRHHLMKSVFHKKHEEYDFNK